MVLPASPPDDASGPATPGWLRRLKVSFGLSRAGLLVLVDHARLERLGELVRTLLPLAPELEVYTEAPSLSDAPPGSTCVLIPRAEDADWLNINRPLFATRALRVVLFCTREVSVALSRKAVDFMDWMSLRLECPAGPPPFAVAGLRHALMARAPGIIWTGGDLEASFAEALPNRTLRRVSAARPYAELVAEAKTRRPREWLAWTDVDGDFRLRRVRWALAEAKQRTRSILVEPTARSPGWWQVQGQLMEPAEAWMRLREAGAQHPNRLAALVDLEPEATQLIDLLLKRGVDEDVLEAEVLGGRDPGAALGQLAFSKRIVLAEQWARGTAPIPAMRALRPERRIARGLRTVELHALETRLKLGEQLDAEDAEWWSAWATVSPSPAWLEGSPQQGAVAETLLRLCQDGKTWEQTAKIAFALRDLEAAHLWSEHAMADNPSNWQPLLLSLRRQGRLIDAESLLRQQLANKEQKPDPERAQLLYLLGDTLYKKSDYAGAEHFLRQSVSLLENEGKALSTDFSTVLDTLARAREKQGSYNEAEELLRRSLLVEERAPEPRTLRIVKSRYNLAVVLEQQGRYAEAELILRQCLASMEKMIGVHHPDFGAVLHTLARTRERQGHYAEAEQLLRRSTSVIEKSLGTEHPTYGAVLHQLAGVLAQQGQHTEAEELMRRALAIIASNSPLHENHAIALDQLASIRGAQAHLDEEESLLRQALSLQEKTLGSQHPRLCSTLTKYGIVLIRRQRAVEGELLLLRAVDIARNVLGLQHPETAQCLNVLAHAQSMLKKSEAVTTAQQAVDGLLRSLGEDHPLVKKSLPQLRRIIAGEE